MTLSESDFEQQPEPDPLGQIWLARMPVPTTIGQFSVEIVNRPDAELLSTANALITALASEHSTIVSAVYGLYQHAAEDRRWMKSCGVPRDLSRSEIADYLTDRCITVRRLPSGDPAGSILVKMRWDDEHLAVFENKNGRLVWVS